MEELQGLGAGRLTVAALRTLMTESASLPPAPPPPPKPVVTAAPMPIPSEAEQKRILGEITEGALSYSTGLPNFRLPASHQALRRSQRNRQLPPTDTIAERLSYFEHKEDYKVISVNGTPVTNRKHEQLGESASERRIRAACCSRSSARKARPNFTGSAGASCAITSCTSTASAWSRPIRKTTSRPKR